MEAGGRGPTVPSAAIGLFRSPNINTALGMGWNSAQCFLSSAKLPTVSGTGHPEDVALLFIQMTRTKDSESMCGFSHLM